ncbi:MAG: hypothetical protein WD361_03155 [Gracilimonas sp.]
MSKKSSPLENANAVGPIKWDSMKSEYYFEITYSDMSPRARVSDKIKEDLEVKRAHYYSKIFD